VVRGIGRIAIGLVLLGGIGGRNVAVADGDSVRGWGYLVDKLEHDGVPRERALRVFRDERCAPFDGLMFGLNPHESPSLYRRLRTRPTAARARRCLDEHRDAFEGAQERFGVSANVVASIIQVESGCGQYTGRSRIVPALARLAMAAEPDNLSRNVDRQLLLNPDLSSATLSSWTRWRADALENTFYPELRAALDVADRLGVDPLEIRGSGSGAFGIPQFLPQSYLWFGVDGDQDGRVSLYDPDDAIPSCAHYLQQYGWRPALTRSEQRNVIWGYNHSDAYIDTVLWLASEVHSPTPEPAHTAPATKRHGHKAPAKKKPGHGTTKRTHHPPA
jgi:membrane-bound lytic murein transglycosylase B